MSFNQITFGIYLVISIILLTSYFYFLFFQKNKHKGDKELDKYPSILVGRATKEWWLWLTKPLENYFVRKKFDPDTLSLLGFAITSFSFVGYSFGWFVVGGWCVLLGGTLDVFDGKAARRNNTMTRTGEFLDSNLDRLSDAMTFLGLLNYYANSLFFYTAFIAFVGSFMTSYTKARAEAMGISIMNMGMMQRPERIVWIGVPSVMSPLFAAAANSVIPVSSTWLASVGVTVVAIMSSYTAYQRYAFVQKTLSEK